MHDIDYRREKAVLPLHGKIDATAAQRLIDGLHSAQEEHFYERVEISIRSEGGQVAALREILQEIRRLRELGVSVDTHVRGMAGSAAAFLATLGDQRRADHGSLYHFHHTRLGDVGRLTALGAATAGRSLARWDEAAMDDLAWRALYATPPAEPRLDALWGEDWHVIARLVSPTALPTAGELDEAQRLDLYDRLRKTVSEIVDEQAADALMDLYGKLFAAEMTITAALARELLLVDIVGEVPKPDRAPADEPCLHVPELTSLWPEGRVPTRFLCRHTLILGETGSGKTMSGIKPLLNAVSAPDLPDGTVGCVLVVDPKKELWESVSDRGARLIDVAGGGGTAVNLMAGDHWDVTRDIASGRYLEAAERILIRSASLTTQSPANALAGRPSGGHNQYWQTDGARMARTALALTLAMLDNSEALFAGAGEAPLKSMSPPALERLRAFGERAGVLVPHADLRAAARHAIDRSDRLATADLDDPIPKEKVLEAWKEFHTVVERSEAHAELPALREVLRRWGVRLRETPGPLPLVRCVQQVMAATLTRLADDCVRRAPSALALAGEVMKVLFSAPPRKQAGDARLYGTGAPTDDSPLLPLDTLEGRLGDVPEIEMEGGLSLRERLRLALKELRQRRFDDLRSWRGTDQAEPMAAVAAVTALQSVCGATVEPLREEVEYWCSIAGGDGHNSHYVGVQAYADQAFFEFAAPAPAWTLYCGCEPYWHRIVARGSGIVDFTNAVDRDSGCEVFVIQPGLGAARHGLVAKALKALFFEAVLTNPRRAAGERMPLVGYIADEFHRFATADSVHGEQSFLDTCRSFNTFCVLACQAMANVHHAFAGVSGAGYGRADDYAIDILLANTGSKYFFRTTDRDTLSRIASMCPTPPGQVSVVDARPPSTLRAGECYVSLPDGRFERRQIGAVPHPASDAGLRPEPSPDRRDDPAEPSPARVLPRRSEERTAPAAPPGLEP